MEDSEKTQTQQIEIVQSSPAEFVSSGSSQGRNPFWAQIVEPGRDLRFSDETLQLLRLRLKAAAIDLIIVLGIGYVGNAIGGNHHWLVLRTLILSGMIGCYVWLRSQKEIGIRNLRGMELFIFGGVALQMSLMMYSRSEHFTTLKDAASLIGVQQFFFTAFCLHILTYGIFMPNTWRRAAVVTVVLACIPYTVQWIQQNNNATARELLSMNHGSAPIPVTFVAALIGSFGSHIINRTRREAFQARQIMQYRLQERIGSGGMGEVYRAEHVLLKRKCAMKLIKPEKVKNPSALASFEREVIATARLTHWNTVEIYDYGHTDDGTFYYVMELLEGRSLQTLVESVGPLPPERVVYLLAQVCDALHEAHAAGLIHRDIKPANIFSACRGGVHDVVKLLDFGLVREVSAPSSDEKRTASFSGTPLYMAPEQVVEYDAVDGRTDIYALGAVAYFMLTGRPPFEGLTTIDTLRAHASSPVTKPSSFQANIPADLENIVLKCLEKDPINRFQTARSAGISIRECACAKEWNADKASQWWKNDRS